MAPGPRPEAHYHTLWCDLRPQAHRHPFRARCPSGGRRGPGQSQTFLGRVRGGPPGLRAGPPHSHPAAVSTRWEGVGVTAGSTRGLSKGASGRRGGWRVGAAWRGRWGWSRGSEVGKPRGRRGPGFPSKSQPALSSGRYGACNAPAPGQQKRMAGSRPPAPGVQDADSPT